MRDFPPPAQFPPAAAKNAHLRAQLLEAMVDDVLEEALTDTTGWLVSTLLKRMARQAAVRSAAEE